MKSFRGMTALVTGASSGLGSEFARQLSLEVSQLLITSRRADRLQALSKEIQAKSPQIKVFWFPADLSCQKGREILCDWLTAERLEIDILINNAGCGDYGLFEESRFDRIRSLLELNVISLTYLTRFVLPQMIRKKRGIIINIGSIVGRKPLPTCAAYSGSKSYVHAFSEALRLEIEGSGVTLTVIAPGPLHTEFFYSASRNDSEEKPFVPPFMWVSLEKVVNESLAAAKAGKAFYVPGFYTRIASFLHYLTPSFFLKPIYRMILPIHLRHDSSKKNSLRCSLPLQ
ncbi:SDR family NAD(P)-dependent oxidoreductase [Candidatus Methylacidiphilum infernorum]|uniref:NADP-dependent 3-hydroxy acid dehydrogenase YdfG n=1 Tax=Methylacidiphilum infernorum (isolate V4) TaxID=481448 RepID=B3DX03_METI4|nr:SDR family oxidoreductase [Candidatus Methylacidiphilum infernorum]ACD82143.1 Short-chain dehydrogenase [Methylacidiphilum infernorum V4]